MASNPTKLRIGMDGDAPCYTYEDESEEGRPDERVRKFIGTPATSRPHAYRSQYPERNLDIRETSKSGQSIYIFEVNMTGLGTTRIIFPTTGPRIIKFPMGFPKTDDFLVEEPSYVQNEYQAAFSCDLDVLRASDIATLIRKNGDIHNHSIRIPFYFNFLDQYLGAAPWSIPTDKRSGHSHPHGTHSHDRKDLEHSGRPGAHGRPDIDTHGGVHPNPLAFYSVSLDE